MKIVKNWFSLLLLLIVANASSETLPLQNMPAKILKNQKESLVESEMKGTPSYLEYQNHISSLLSKKIIWDTKEKTDHCNLSLTISGKGRLITSKIDKPCNSKINQSKVESMISKVKNLPVPPSPLNKDLNIVSVVLQPF